MSLMKTSTLFKQMMLTVALASPQLMMAGDININASFPDPNVRAAVAGWDSDGNGILSDEEQENMTYLSLYSSDITDLTGVNLLKKLHDLYINDNPGLVTADLSNMTSLTTLIANNTGLTSLNLTGLTNLSDMRIYDNAALTSIDVSGLTNLEVLLAYNSGLTSIDVSGLTKLSTLEVHQCNNLTSITAKGCTTLSSIPYLYYGESFPNLKSITITNNTAMNGFSTGAPALESLDLTNCTGLETMDVNEKEQLTSVTLTGCTSLRSLSANNNASLAALDVSGLGSLESLYAYDNPALASLTLTGLTALNTLYVSGDPMLKAINVSELTELEYLYAYDSGLTSINVSGLTKLSTLEVYRCNDLTMITANGCSALSYISNLNSYEYFPSLKSLTITGNTALTSFSAGGPAQLESLDLTNCTSLTSVDASNMDLLTSLTLTGCTALTTLSVNGNASLATLDVSGLGNLASLCAYQNPVLASLTLTGLTALNTLYVSGDPSLKAIDVSELTELEYLYAYDSGLTSIDVSGLTKLSTLEVHRCNDLTSITANGCTALIGIPDLYYDEYYPSLKSLTITGNTAMTNFSVSNLPLLESIDMTDCTGLTGFTANNLEKLTSVTLTGCTVLAGVEIKDNYILPSVDLSGLNAMESATISQNDLLADVNLGEGMSLTNLYVFFNPSLEALTVKSPTLTYLDCSNNSLKTLDVTGCPELDYLICSNNQLTSLDLSKNTKLSSSYTDQYDVKVQMVYLSATEVGFAVNDAFHSEKVTSFMIDWDEKVPTFVTVDGVKYFQVYDNAAEAEEYLNGKTLRYGYDTGREGHTLNNTLSITGYTKAPSFLKVSPDVVNGVYGGTVTAPTLTRSQDYNGAVTYTSGNTNVVTVAADGKLTVKGAGETTVTITGVETTYRLAPEPVSYTVKIAKASPKFTFANATLEMVIQGEVPGNTLNKGVYDGTVSYSSSDTNIATVAANGTVTVKAAGEVTITASGAETNNCNAPTAASYKLTIKKKTTTLSIASAQVEGVYGGTVNNPAVTLNGYDGTLAYASSNTNVVTVAANGKLTVKGAGEATITVSAPETAIYYAPANVTYKVKIAKASPTIAFAQSVIVVEKGIEETIENPLNVGIYDGTITYSSSDPSFVAVDATGKVTFLKVARGTVTITANGAATGNCNAVKAAYDLTVNVTTGINGMAMIPHDGHYYTPAGVLVVKPVKGRLYIRNGKKVVYK